MRKAIRLIKKNRQTIIDAGVDENFLDVLYKERRKGMLILDSRKGQEGNLGLLSYSAFKKKFEFIYGEKDGEFARVRELPAN